MQAIKKIKMHFYSLAIFAEAQEILINFRRRNSIPTTLTQGTYSQTDRQNLKKRQSESYV